MVQNLRLAPGQASPPGFASWVDRNIALHDPVLRSKVVSDTQAASASSAAALPATPSRPATNFGQSYKCSDERCMYYIYGFASLRDCDAHVHTHVAPVKRDSGLSMGNSPPVLVPRHHAAVQPLLVPESPQYSTNFMNPRRPSLPTNPSPLTISTTQLPSPRPPQLQSQQQQPTPILDDARERRGSSVSYSFPPHHPTIRKRSDDSDVVDPLLPPLKRSRVGHSRLQSIGELQLLKDNEPCLRCRLANRQVSKSGRSVEQSTI